MGKTVGLIIGIVAAVAIAVVLPGIGHAAAIAIFGHLATATAIAFTTAVIGVGLSLAVGFAFKAIGIGSVPKAKLTTSEPRPTAVVGHFGPKPSYKLERRMSPIMGSFLNRLRRSYFGRFGIVEFVGDCMAPRMTDRYGIVDLDADIRTGDLMGFGVKDAAIAFPEYGSGFGVTKRFLGFNLERGIVECDCFNPPRTIHVDMLNLTHAHRVRATAPAYWSAVRLLRRVRRNPAEFDAPLMPLAR